ncbi:MAG: hypothetical protein IAI49_10065 [Candidatus Eremiobacteraeota bacterium]|nr:hypothetical protein [Candidatus Eremiobacteraeota bacterium]
MLAVVALAAGLGGSPKPALSAPANAACPAFASPAFATGAATCPALEISGRFDATGASIDPAFDVSVPSADLARPAEGGATLAGFAADGRALFALPIAANGAFHVYVSLAPAAQQLLVRLRLTAGSTTAERTASTGAEATAELIAVSEQRVIVAWNASAFPAIRVAESPEKAPIASGSGTSTYEQMAVDTRVRRVYVVFSDGVRSTTRGFTIFGR